MEGTAKQEAEETFSSGEVVDALSKENVSRRSIKRMGQEVCSRTKRDWI